MKASTPAPERLARAAHAPDSDEALAAAYLEAAARRPELGPAALARIGARLTADDEGPARPARLRWKTIAAVVALGVGSGGATGAAVWVVAPIVRAHRSLSPATTALPAPPARRERAPRRAPAADTTLPAPGVSAAATAPSPAGAPAGEPSPAGPRAPRATRTLALAAPDARAAHPPAPPAAAGSEALAEEAELLAVALRRLRRDRDPRGALAALDAHAARFGDGALGPEAEIARVEALLALDRRAQALAVLERRALPDTARGRELAVVRAELRAGGRRCPDAIADFSRALADPALDAGLTERALHGRAACRLADGDRAAAKRDLDAYLLRFPDGRFAAESRRARGEIEPGAAAESFRPSAGTGTGGTNR
jgi:hypothetical protein